MALRLRDETPALPARVSVRMKRSAPGIEAGAVIERDRVEAIQWFLLDACEFVDVAPSAEELKAQARAVFEQLENERGRMGEGDWLKIPIKRRAYEKLCSVLEGAPQLGGDAA